jgi:uncharacterized protein YdaU (DUF1376 family)
VAKDPAFLFYSSDFYTGTAFMTDEQVGKYIRLLCLQHQHGHLDASAMQKLCGGIADATILDKFLLDSGGKYYNQRIDIEIDKRKKHSEKQTQNALMRWHKSGNAVAMPLENENENENRNEDINESEIKKEIVKRKQFEVPTIQEIADYCKERNNSVDAQSFFDHYESRDWKPKGYTVRMKDWKATVRTWEKNNFGNGFSNKLKQSYEKDIGSKYDNIKKDVINVN